MNNARKTTTPPINRHGNKELQKRASDFASKASIQTNLKSASLSAVLVCRQRMVCNAFPWSKPL
jgi:hypothetical protein